MRVIDENSVDKVQNMKDNYKKMKLDCLVILGGNGTQKTANLLREEGLNVVSLPKTIDNDVWGTDMTFGFHSSVEIATMSSTAFTPPPPPTAAFSVWRSWGTRSAGCRFMPASRAVQM